MEKPYVTRTFTLTLRITETPTGVPADVRLAHVLKYAGRVQGFRCVRSEEVKAGGNRIADFLSEWRGLFTSVQLESFAIQLKELIKGELLDAKETQK